jgi:hypothetical protein
MFFTPNCLKENERIVLAWQGTWLWTFLLGMLLVRAGRHQLLRYYGVPKNDEPERTPAAAKRQFRHQRISCQGHKQRNHHSPSVNNSLSREA